MHNFIINLGNEFACSLKDILIFATGADETPPLKFVPASLLQFTEESKFPLENNCANIMVLSLSHNNCGSFKDAMKTEILNASAYGMPK